MATEYEITDYEIGDGKTWSITGKAVFDIEAETYPAEPYSWGGSRGTELAVSAKFAALVVGKLVLNRYEIMKLLADNRWLWRLEDEAAEEWARLYEMGEVA